MKPVDRRWALASAAAVIVAAALLATWPVLESGSKWGIQDWDQHLFHHAVARKTIVEYRQVPLWNPYNQSGVPLLANPESQILSPGFALVLLLGELAGLKLEIVLHLVLGTLGALLLLRSHHIGWLGSLTGAFLFGFNSWYSVHLAVGHTWALSIAFLPWALICQRRSLVAPVYAIPASLLLVTMFFAGGVYPLIMTLVLMLTHATARVLLRQDTLAQQVRTLALIAAISLPLSAVKLFPTATSLWSHPRTTPLESGYTWSALANALLDRDQALVAAHKERPEEFNDTTIHEGLYIGLIPLLLFGCGALGELRRASSLLLTLSVFLWLVLGAQVRPSLWAALHALPVFDNLRMIQRFGIAAVVPLSVVVGYGFDALWRWLARASRSPRLAGAAMCALSLVVLADLVLVNRSVFEPAFSIPPRRIQPNRVFRQASEPPRYSAKGTVEDYRILATTSGLYPAFLSNRGSTIGYRIVPIPSRAIAAGRRDYRGEVFLEQGHGRVVDVRWSPNRLRIAVEVASPDLLVVNQNFDPGWRRDGEASHPVDATRGLISTRVDPGDTRVELFYRPTSFVLGAWLSVASLIALPWVAGRLRRSTRARAPGGAG